MTLPGFCFAFILFALRRWLPAAARVLPGVSVAADPMPECRLESLTAESGPIDLHAMPSSYLVDRSGRIVEVHRGFTSDQVEVRRRAVERLQERAE